MRPAEFWQLTPLEVWWLIDAKTPKPQYAGGMTEAQVAELYAENYPEDGE